MVKRQFRSVIVAIFLYLLWLVIVWFVEINALPVDNHDQTGSIGQRVRSMAIVWLPFSCRLEHIECRVGVVQSIIFATRGLLV